jgi:hypothetical protein
MKMNLAKILTTKGEISIPANIPSLYTHNRKIFEQRHKKELCLTLLLHLY